MKVLVTGSSGQLGSYVCERLRDAHEVIGLDIREEAVEGINSMWVGAKGIEAIEKMMKLSQGTAPANTPATPTIDADKLKEMRFAKDENGNRRMSTDPAYRAKVLAAEASLNGGSADYVVHD